MALVWSERSCVYVLGVVCLGLATPAFAVCLVAPFWQLQAEDPALGVPLLHIGLWFRCRQDWACFSHYSNDEDYLHVTRGLQVAGLLSLVICVVMTCVANCRRDHPGNKVEVAMAVVTFLTALQCLSGPLVYLAFTMRAVQHLSHLHYNWAFFLSLLASCLALLASALLILQACRHASPCSGSSPHTKTQTVLNWQHEEQGEEGEEEEEDDLYADPLPQQMFGAGELEGRNGPYTITGEDVYFFDDVHHHDDHHPDLPHCSHSLRSEPFPPFLPSPQPGEPEHPSGLFPLENVDTDYLTAYPQASPGYMLSRWYAGQERGGACEERGGAGQERGGAGQEGGGASQERGGAGEAGGGGGGHLTTSWSWHDGLELFPVQTPPWGRRRGRGMEEQWHHGDDPPASWMSDPGDPFPLPQPHPAPHTPPFMFPRVVVRGYYEPGYGYPEFIMN
ncbi:uncharacterized protein LOC143294536 [Babylonia areolata]|uniref:uncharacterized protein LOC143294536 n=1 Tax=Babylonia areolata TaxID=304850 RepID=UPI003FD05BD9